MLLCTLDITSLYTNIPHIEGIQATKKMMAIHKPPNSLPHNSYIIELLEIVLTNNHFEFNGKHYHHVLETAMGTKLAPSYANLFMTKFEEKYVITYQLQPKLWKSFIDDIFLIWPYGMSHLATWNGFTLGIHKPYHYQIYKWHLSHKISFLDLIVYIKASKLYMRLHNKITDRCMNLNYFSEHPMSLKRSIPYSQFLRL